MDQLLSCFFSQEEDLDTGPVNHGLSPDQITQMKKDLDEITKNEMSEPYYRKTHKEPILVTDM